MVSDKRKMAFCALLLAVGFLVTGCATVPPQPIGSGSSATAAPAASDAVAAGQGTAVPAENTEPVSAPAESAGVADATAPAVADAPQTVEIFYSGMPSMMGFADAPQATVYEQTAEALPACVSLCWSSAQVLFYRYSVQTDKAGMAVTRDTLLRWVGEPAFYRDEPMTNQPARVKAEGEAISTEAARLNEPVPDFFAAAGVERPAASGSLSGTPAAVAASDPAALTLIVTDLHELRMDDGALLSALNQYALEAGRTVGVAAIRSEFAGYVPEVGANGTSFVWGDEPSGSLETTLDYGDYTLGISIDPEQRQTAPRPFYVLCIGEQEAVDAYLAALSGRLQGELAANQAFRMETAVFGGAYVPQGYTMAGHMRYLSGQGVTAVADPSAPAGVALVELKASQQTRYLEWELDYTVHASDPRGASLAAEDFTFIAEAVSAQQRTVLPNLSWQIAAAQGNTVTLRLRLELPQGALSSGSYTMEIFGSLAAPDELPGSDWAADFGYDADGAQILQMEQGTIAFDGSRTLFLSRLIDTLGVANLGRLGVTSLGMVSLALTVYA